MGEAAIGPFRCLPDLPHDRGRSLFERNHPSMCPSLHIFVAENRSCVSEVIELQGSADLYGLKPCGHWVGALNLKYLYGSQSFIPSSERLDVL